MEDIDVLMDIEDSEVIEYLQRRQRRACPDRVTDLDCLDEAEFKSRYRLNKKTVESLIQMLGDRLSHSERNFALSSAEKICLALRFFATGSYQIVLGDLSFVSQTSACRAINEVARALAELRPSYIHLPQTELERHEVFFVSFVAH